MLQMLRQIKHNPALEHLNSHLSKESKHSRELGIQTKHFREGRRVHATCIGGDFSEEVIFFFFFRATFVGYESSQASGRIRAIAAGQHHSHSSARSKL